jgi:outer membrane protein TolC
MSAGAQELPSMATSSTKLTLESYLKQVRENNKALVSYTRQKESARLQVRTNDVQLSPSLVSSAQAEWDSRKPGNALLSYDRIETQNYSFGVKQDTRYGTSLSLGYAVDYTNYVNMLGGPLSYYDARPVLEVSQQLLKNGFGKSTQAGLKATEAKWKAEEYAADSGMDTITLNAETAYWKLAIAREIVSIQEKSLHQAQAIYDYVAGMAKKNLYEKADVIQAQASLESTRLSLKQAQDDERAALRAFNSYRNADPGSDPGELLVFDLQELESVTPPSRRGSKAGVKAAEFKVKSTQEQVKVSMDENLPSLVLFGSYAMNGRGPFFEDSISDSLVSGLPTSTVGVRFSVPLDRSAVSDVNKGLGTQSAAAALSYEQMLADQEQEWADLSAKLFDAREQLKMAKTIEGVQQEKLDNERLRLRQGRTTTYQVLQFEQDHLKSELTCVGNALSVLSLLAQMRPYRY